MARPERTVYVAFDQAAVCYLAGRQAAYRYMFSQEMAAILDAEADLVALAIGPDRPLYVMSTGELAPLPDRGLAFWQAVRAHYRFATFVEGVPIYHALA